MFSNLDKFLVILVLVLLVLSLLFGIPGVDAQPVFRHPGYPGILANTTGWTDASWNRPTKSICFWRKFGGKKRYAKYTPPTERHFNWDKANLMRKNDRVIYVFEICPRKP